MVKQYANIDIDEVIKKAAKEAAQEAILELCKEQKDKRVHNTWLLMKNYNRLKDHIDEVRADIEFDIEAAEDKVWLTSIVRTKLRTMQMLAYIDSAIEILRNRFKANCEEYKFKAFELYFIDEIPNNEISVLLGAGKNSPKLWTDTVLNELSLLLWGIESLGI